jgi:hypothetical protein
MLNLWRKELKQNICKIVIGVILLLITFTFSTGQELNKSQVALSKSNIPVIKSLSTKTLKKTNGTNSYVVDYWPIYWSWYMDYTGQPTTSQQYFQNPRLVNGGWHFEMFYHFQISSDDSFKNIIFADSMVQDRYNYYKWPVFTKKWMDTLGTARPLLDTTYYMTRDSSWVRYDVPLFVRVNARWLMFDTTFFWFGHYLPEYKLWYDSPEYSISPWSVTTEFIMPKPLPVELIFFTSEQDRNRVILRWKTATETDCYGFYVDKKTIITPWENIGFVQGHGTTHIHREYSFVDNNPNIYTTNYYRLKQLGNNGFVEDLWTTEINMITDLSYPYPNPADGQITISLVIINPGNITVKIYDIKGNLMNIPVNDIYYTTGKYYIEINTLNYSSGIYLYDLLIGSRHTTNKFIVMH